MFLHHLTSAFFQFAMRRFVKNTNTLEKVKVIWYNVTYNNFSSNSRDITGEDLNPTEIATTAILNYAFTFIPSIKIANKKIEVDAKRSSGLISTAKRNLSTSVKHKGYYKSIIRNERIKIALFAGIYALSTPVFSFITYQASIYMEKYLYGTKRYSLS